MTLVGSRKEVKTMGSSVFRGGSDAHSTQMDLLIHEVQ